MDYDKLTKATMNMMDIIPEGKIESVFIILSITEIHGNDPGAIIYVSASEPSQHVNLGLLDIAKQYVNAAYADQIDVGEGIEFEEDDELDTPSQD